MMLSHKRMTLPLFPLFYYFIFLIIKTLLRASLLFMLLRTLRLGCSFTHDLFQVTKLRSNKFFFFLKSNISIQTERKAIFLITNLRQGTMDQGPSRGLNRKGDRKTHGGDKKEKKFETAAPMSCIGRKQHKHKFILLFVIFIHKY